MRKGWIAIYKVLSTATFNNTIPHNRAMLEMSLLLLVAFIVFGTILGFLFLMPLVVVGANAIILYFLFLRIYTEITKYKRSEHYALSFVAAMMILLIVKNFLSVWWITTATLLAFVITHVYILFEKKH